MTQAARIATGTRPGTSPGNGPDTGPGTSPGTSPGPGPDTGPALVVMAKAPVAGLAKTRLCPPLSGEQAAALARAALEDTLAAVLATRAARRVLVLDGEPGEWLPAGVEVLAQRGGDLAERLADAFEDVGGPTLLIGMDTPQVTPALLDESLERLADDDCDALLGRTLDGGYWAIGLSGPDRRVFAGVPMSRADTGAIQLARLRELGLRTRALPTLRDVDVYEDVIVVAGLAGEGAFGRAVMTVDTVERDSLRAAV
jgi:rSAM/selenodomain-associated transferase 1